MFSLAPENRAVKRMRQFSVPSSIYPFQREEVEEKNDKLEQFLQIGVESVGKSIEVSRYRKKRFVKKVLEQSSQLESKTEQDLKEEVFSLKLCSRKSGVTEDYLIRCFAVVRELSYRILGMKHYPAQIEGGFVLVHGMVAEMETGQGKSLMATLASASVALSGMPAHIITVNEYLAGRDADFFQPLYKALGLSVSTVLENMSAAEKRVSYRADVVYCTNKQVAFDHLRDRMELLSRPGDTHLKLENLYRGDGVSSRLIMRGLCFAIVDEADSVLIDEAVTPLVISKTRSSGERNHLYQQSLELAKTLQMESDFRVYRQQGVVQFTEHGIDRLSFLSRRYGGLWSSARIREELVIQALKAIHLFICDRHYLVQEGKVNIIDEFTGRIMSDRSWEKGLQQMIELKEGCEPTDDRETIARISYQRFFRRYLHLSGMTGTGSEVQRELWSVYRLKVVRIKPEQKIHRYHLPMKICRTEQEKWQEVIRYVRKVNQKGAPVLIGTRSVEASESLSRLLHEKSLAHQLLNAREDQQEAEIIAHAGEPGRITIATNMAGRGTDIKLTEQAKLLGGLHVVVTERHESRRIDRQLYGRCGRQGDPGRVATILSLEDDLVEQNSPVTMLMFLKRFPVYAVENLLFKMAQTKVERRHFTSRKMVLKGDEYYANMLAFSGQPE